MHRTKPALRQSVTCADYMKLPEGTPAVLIDGGLVSEPSPTSWHQRVVLAIAMRLESVVGLDRVLVAPVDVVLDDLNVLQPDILVRAPDAPVRRGREIRAIPVLVVEVLSPATAARDRDVKTPTYLRAGVAEVWLVDPDSGAIEVHTRERVRRFGPTRQAVSGAVPGFRLRGRDVVP